MIENKNLNAVQTTTAEPSQAVVIRHGSRANLFEVNSKINGWDQMVINLTGAVQASVSWNKRQARSA